MADAANPVAFDAQRGSRLSIAALLMAVVLFIPGAIIPGPGVIAATLGAIALFRVGRSRGRLRGRTPAAVAVLLGILQTMLGVGLWIGAAGGLARLTQAYGPAMTAIESDDVKALGDMLAPSLTGEHLPTAMAHLRQAYTAEHGTFTRMPRGVGEIVTGILAIGWREGRGDDGVIRLPARFTEGVAGVRFHLDPDPNIMANGARRIINVGVDLSDGTTAWLVARTGP